MNIFIDKDFKCHLTNDGTMRMFDVPALDGKCPAYIKGTRYVPLGETWRRSDGEVFEGEMTSPCIDSRIRDAYQEQYEAMLPEMEDMQTALELLEVNPNGV